MTTAVCPGSFDPITNGHLDIVTRASRHFDEVVVLVTGNPTKTSGLFSIDERVELIREVIAHLPNVRVDSWGGLLVDYTSAHHITALVKGLRSSLDYEYELPMAQMNRRLTGVDTYFLLTDEKYGYISSSLTKEVAKFGGDVTGLVPDSVREAMAEKYR
ncbi:MULTISPECIES: pantetheine-phosphate adenylyltransferase [Corynebacterium]|uniref:Phosphopantetheine adenylyltransferase n=1 Tax=Corynebacterium lehmanniae TaxID=2913497 RepID=A0ABT4R8S8_9CORY|nr:MULTISPECIES: pantetheine-phosphate adenylyltransferase [Corynebacterium]RUQ11404.1 pantetheine-phosphate adenylyltransferase [Corynebacterium genitalium]MCG7236226.1 pantetheine-phosphate adenylyltransferase [Corynebacterium sp. ACRQP]MCG7274826.1 pantetheine-phosphate adenylyltransferase [Corynebacterium afermentans]MCZ9291914.1 pantetheine-phosphate adenylyltransferase [Corynebacterium lehmanniae]MDL0403410.1 pantetheine-phosphate adenylyltransferase [Corynebacterium lehmanniae]